MDTICREYIKQTQMLFPIIRKKERIYLKSLYNDLIEYCDINKISNLQELFHEYGPPAQIVQEYLSSLNEADLKNCLKRKHIKKILFICCVTVPAILVSSVNPSTGISCPLVVTDCPAAVLNVSI